jgi:hypothetical protein
MSLDTRHDSGLWLFDEATTTWGEREFNQNKSNICVSGYPRSGNTFLNYVIFKMYPSLNVFNNFHTIKSIENHSTVFIPIRNPIDCIGSWAYYQKYYFGDGYLFKIEDINTDTITNDINYYLRFHNDAMNFKNKITLLDFDVFTKDINYIEDKFKIKKEKNVNIDTVKRQMSMTDKKINLPANNKKKLNEIKEQVSQHPRIQECYDLYNKLRGHL